MAKFKIDNSDIERAGYTDIGLAGTEGQVRLLNSANEEVWADAPGSSSTSSLVFSSSITYSGTAFFNLVGGGGPPVTVIRNIDPTMVTSNFGGFTTTNNMIVATQPGLGVAIDISPLSGTITGSSTAANSFTGNWVIALGVMRGTTFVQFPPNYGNLGWSVFQSSFNTTFNLLSQRVSANFEIGDILAFRMVATHSGITNSGGNTTISFTMADDTTIFPFSRSGHIIENSSGVDFVQRNHLQFTGVATVTDDATGDRTIVDIPTNSFFEDFDLTKFVQIGTTDNFMATFTHGLGSTSIEYNFYIDSGNCPYLICPTQINANDIVIQVPSAGRRAGKVFIEKV